MKQYRILAESITSYRGKQLLKGEIHPESEFMVNHCPLLCNAGHIEEVPEEEIKEEQPEPEEPNEQNPEEKPYALDAE